MGDDAIVLPDRKVSARHNRRKIVSFQKPKPANSKYWPALLLFDARRLGLVADNGFIHPVLYPLADTVAGRTPWSVAHRPR